MYFQQFLNQQHGCASYLVASRQSHEAAIIDPGIKVEPYEAILREREFQLRYVIDTHIHADHVSGARQLADRYNAELCLHHLAKTNYAFRPLEDNEELELGQLRLRVWHTPGHRPELISILVIDTARCAEPPLVLTGDSLLVGDIGRPDFGGGDAAAQYESVTRLLALPAWVEVFPGHYEGPCGNDMWGRPSTTIGFEQQYNPLAQLDRDRFVTTLIGSVPSRPLNMTAIEATNRGNADMSWAMLTTAPAVPEITVQELQERLPDIFLLDVREPDEYARIHIPGALNVPQAELSSRLDDIPHDQPIFIVCQTGSRSLRSAQFLLQTGYQEVTNVAGGTSAWRRAGQPVERKPS